MIRRLFGSWISRLLITIAIFWWMATRVDLAAGLRAVAGVSAWSIVGVTLLVIVDRVLMTWRWVMLLRGTGTAIDFGDAWRMVNESSFVGSFMPAGVGGDAARAWQLSREHARGSVALASVAVDRLLGIIALALLALAGVVAWASAIDSHTRLWVWGIAGLGVVGSMALLWVDRLARPVLHLVPTTARLRVKLERLTGALSDYRAQPGLMLRVLAASVFVQALRVVQCWVWGLGLGIAMPVSYYLVFMPIGLLMLLLPISISGFGAPQGVMVWLLAPAGVPADRAFALSTLLALSGLVANLPGGWLYLTRRRTVS